MSKIDRIDIGALSNAMKMPSFEASGPLKPPLSSATRQQDRTNRHTVAIAMAIWKISYLCIFRTIMQPLTNDKFLSVYTFGN